MSPSTRSDRSPASDLTANASPSPGTSALRRELAGIALILFALFLGGALAAQGVAMMRAEGDVTASFGWAGKFLAAPLGGFLGWPAAALVPIALAAHALRLFGRLDQRTDRSWMIFLLGFVVLLPVGISLAEGGLREATALSGLWGSFTAFYLLQFAGTAGAWIVLLLSLSALMAATLSWNPIRALVGRKPKPVDALVNEEALTALGWNGVKARRRKAMDFPPEPTPEEMPGIDVGLMDADDAVEDARALRGEKAKRVKKSKSDVAADHADRIALEIDSTEHVGLATDDELPPFTLMSPAETTDARDRRDRDRDRELDAMGAKLMEALRTFKVDGELVGRTTGPAVTQFEIAPAAGVKVRQFATLANDLALAMRAQSIRIVAPIPGKGAVGVEVPNPTPEMVAFSEMLLSREYQKMPAALPIALGKDL
ncbi:MAG: DNA translocase FtsK 4TM domain-containing protein, partial [Gemmatimonadaceae bacterium]